MAKGLPTERSRLKRIDEMRTLRKQYREFVEKAGIADKVERCEDSLGPSIFDEETLPPLFTKARDKALKELLASNRLFYRDCVRRAVFGAEDKDLRRQII